MNKKQPVYCSFAADVVCSACAQDWRAYVPDGCEDVNSLGFECPRCHRDTGFQIKWWPSSIPSHLQHDHYEEE